MVIAEQNAGAALSIAHYGYVLQNGNIASEGPAQVLAGQQAVKESYLGLQKGGRFISRHATRQTTSDSTEASTEEKA